MLLVTGITGLTGRFLYQHLEEAGIEYKALIRESSDISWVDDIDSFNYIYGDVSDVDSLVSAMDGVDSVIHLVHIRFSPQVVEACKNAGVDRLVIIGSTGMFSKYREYAEEYVSWEENINQSGLKYTVIRPTMIYGNQQDKNIHKLVKLTNKLPVFPILGSGESLLQPVYARDLAWAVLKAWEKEIAVNKKYNISGGNALSFNKIIDEIIKNIDSRPRTLHIPEKLALMIGKAGEYIPNNLITYERVKRLTEDKDFDHDKAAKELGYDPITFEEGIKLEVEALKEADVI